MATKTEKELFYEELIVSSASSKNFDDYFDSILKLCKTSEQKDILGLIALKALDLGNRERVWGIIKKIVENTEFSSLSYKLRETIQWCLTMTGFYIKDPKAKKLAARSCNSLTKCRGHVSKVSYDNLKYYYTPLPFTKINYLDKAIHPRIPKPKLNGRESVENMFLFNPSIIKTDNKFIANLRFSNYKVKFPGGIYDYMDAEGCVRTTNHISVLSKNLDVLTQQELVDPPGLNYNNGRVRGYEDIRFFGVMDSKFFNNNGKIELLEIKKVLCFSCTRLDIVDKPQIFYGEIDLDDIMERSSPYNDKFPDTPEIGNVIVPRYFVRVVHPSRDVCEKNHMFHIYENKIYNIYNHNPCVTYRFDKFSGTLFNECFQKNTGVESEMRGGAPPIELKNGNWLGTVHEVIFDDGRRYHTRYIEYKREINPEGLGFVPIKISDAVKVGNSRVEFSISLMIDFDGNIVSGYGLNDSQGVFVTSKYEDIEKLLIPIESYYTHGME